MNIVFFGSTTDSVIVLSTLKGVTAVVTQPPKPVGRNKTMTPTPVEIWAKKKGIRVLYAPSQVNADLLVSASYGEKIPMEWITSTPHGGLNVHPSLLPRWRGADPVPWAILSGDKSIGVTVVTLSLKFDQGRIIAQQQVPITNTDTADELRTRLFTIGATLLVDALPDYIAGKNKGKAQPKHSEPYAKRFTRDDGFEPWDAIINPQEAPRINRKFRALHPWPGVWTLCKGKRLKILGFEQSPTVVQLEGKKPVSWQQFELAYLSS